MGWLCQLNAKFARPNINPDSFAFLNIQFHQKLVELSGNQRMRKIYEDLNSRLIQARIRVGGEPVQRLHDELVVPIAIRARGRTTKGAWYRKWRLVSIDAGTLDVADTARACCLARGWETIARVKSRWPKT